MNGWQTEQKEMPVCSKLLLFTAGNLQPAFFVTSESPAKAGGSTRHQIPSHINKRAADPPSCSP
jgi:hypothetical protein